MRILFLFLSCCCYEVIGGVFDGWSPSTWVKSWKGLTGFDSSHANIDTTGKGFATLLGYPAKCEKQGTYHSCTLSFACWMVGGSSESGCQSHPWLVGCCVTKKNREEQNEITDYGDYYVPENDYKEQLEMREGFLRLPIIQKRNNKVEEECGLSADRILIKRIIGGDEANFGEFPWQAHIKINNYQCGGVLVSRKFVATAAHCIIRARLRDIIVYLGELDTQDTGKVVEYAPAEMHRVRKKIIHPKFQFRTTQPDRYDIALLELITEAGRSFHIMPICLPQRNLKLQGRNAVVAGWGKVKPSNELMGTNVLRRASVPILGEYLTTMDRGYPLSMLTTYTNIEKCTSWHEIKQISVELHEEMLCAGHEDGHQDACLGDSGGPLIILDGGKWTLAGITSAGFGCGEPHQPGIYHSVPHTSNWIRSMIRKRKK